LFRRVIIFSNDLLPSLTPDRFGIAGGSLAGLFLWQAS